MRALRNALFSNLGLRKVATFRKFQNYFLNLLFTYFNSAKDFLAIDINLNVKIKEYEYHTITYKKSKLILFLYF